MKIQPRTIKHEKFKELVKEWLYTHREEYCAFANEVGKRDRSGFQKIFQYAQFAAQTFADVVMASMSDNREEDLIGSLEKLFEDSDLATKLVDEFQSQDTVSLSVSERGHSKRTCPFWTSPQKFVVLGDQT